MVIEYSENLKKNKILFAMFLAMVLCAFYIYASHTTAADPFLWKILSPANFTNYSSTINLTLNVSSDIGAGYEVVNVTFYFQRSGSTTPVRSFTITNTSRNQTHFSNLSSLQDFQEGVYNITFNFTNVSAASGFNATIVAFNNSNSSMFHIILDNNAPNVSFGMNVTNNSNLSSSLVGKITFNATINDSTSHVQAVKIGVQNNNNTGFNLTAKLNFTSFSVELDTALVTDGVYTFTVYANDTLNNLNSSVANLTVTLDRTGPNVTAATLVVGNLSGYASASSGSIFGYNFSAGLSEGNLTLQITTNDSFTYVSTVIFNLSNRSGQFVFDPAGQVIFNSSVNGTIVATRVQLNYTSGNHTEFNGSSDINKGPFNLSRLAEGWYNVSVVVNDTLNNFNRSIHMAFIIDRTLPSVSVTCSPIAATAGETVTCTCTVADDYPGSGKLLGSFEGGGTSESTTAAGSAGTSSTCTGIDYAGNRRTATASWTVSAASSGGGGGGGRSEERRVGKECRSRWS